MSEHFPASPNCPFCRSNDKLKGKVIAEIESAYLVQASYGPGNYLIIPAEHIESALNLPDTWWRDVKTLLSRVPDLLESYNLSFNLGEEAGQTIKHLHLWIIPRMAGQPSSGKGLARLIDEADAK